MQKYFKPISFIFIYLLIYLAMQTIVTIVYSISFAIYYFINIGNEASLETFTESMLKGTLPSVLISTIISIPIYYLIVKKRNENFLNVCGFRKASISTISLSSVFGISFGVFVMMALLYINFVFPLDKLPGNYEYFSEIIMNGNIILVFLTVGIMGPIIEEIIFRGLVLSELNKISRPITAVIIQGVIFGLYHMMPLQILYAIPVGIVIGLIMMRSKSLWAPILVHIFFNSINIVFDKILTEQQTEIWGIPLLISSFIILSISFIILWVTEKNKVN